MVLLRILKQFKNGIKEYFENTTVHGFRYILVARTPIYKFFWIISILATVSLCFLLIGRSLKEASDNPIMTNTEEVEVDQLPLPTISILAPKELDPGLYHKTLLNMVDACNPELNLKEHPMFVSFHKLMPIINEVIRNATSASLDTFGAMAPDDWACWAKTGAPEAPLGTAQFSSTAPPTLRRTGQPLWIEAISGRSRP